MLQGACLSVQADYVGILTYFISRVDIVDARVVGSALPRS
jgi:hypothetical protein